MGILTSKSTLWCLKIAGFLIVNTYKILENTMEYSVLTVHKLLKQFSGMVFDTAPDKEG